MGIYDREYYRDETARLGLVLRRRPGVQDDHPRSTSSSSSPSGSSPTGATDSSFHRLFAANSDDDLQALPGLAAPDRHVPPRREHIFHILWNMLFLWIVGREMESMYGSRDFTVLYLTAAVFSTLVLGARRPAHRRRPRRCITMVGASGAVMAVVVLYTLYYPRREILLFFVLPVEMWLLLVVFLGLDALMLLQQLQGAGRHARPPRRPSPSHLGGALYGYLYQAVRPPLGPPAWTAAAAGPGSGSSRPSRGSGTATSAAADDPVALGPPLGRGQAAARSPVVPEEQLDARLDEVLAKIAREGPLGPDRGGEPHPPGGQPRARNRRSDRL